MNYGLLTTRQRASMLGLNSHSRLAGEHGSPIPRRCLLLGAFLVAWMLAAAARLYYLQVIQHHPLLNRAQKRQQQTVNLPPERGIISGRRMQPLAMSREADSI